MQMHPMSATGPSVAVSVKGSARRSSRISGDCAESMEESSVEGDRMCVGL